MSNIDWQLYDEMRGAGLANHVLNKKFANLIKASQKIDLEPEWIRDSMYETMSKYAHLGARDTEPECVLCYEIERQLSLEPNSLER